MSIPFTQYLLPDGGIRHITIDMPPEIEEKAFDLMQQGCYFEAETLGTGMVSLTCETADDLVAIELCDNGSPVIDAVQRLIETAYRKEIG